MPDAKRRNFNERFVERMLARRARNRYAGNHWMEHRQKFLKAKEVPGGLCRVFGQVVVRKFS